MIGRFFNFVSNYCRMLGDIYTFEWPALQPFDKLRVAPALLVTATPNLLPCCPDAFL